jgi:protein TonB
LPAATYRLTARPGPGNPRDRHPGRAAPAEPLYLPEFAPAGRGTLWIALSVSFLVHALLLFIRFEYPDASPFNKLSPTIEVVLVNSKSASRPRKADALAQADLDGGGNTQEKRRAKSNLPALPDMPADTRLALSSQRVQQLEQEAQRLLTRLEHSDQAVNTTTLPMEQLLKAPAEKLIDLPDQQLQIARLEAEIAREWQAYQELPKRKFIGARTQGVVYAEYVDEWRQRIERVGTANFPPQARERAEFGTALVTVAIRADGSVEKVEIDRSSGSSVLDAAVARIVMLAGPFKPFPPKVRGETDILHITRNWSFTRSDLLVQ